MQGSILIYSFNWLSLRTDHREQTSEYHIPWMTRNVNSCATACLWSSKTPVLHTSSFRLCHSAFSISYWEFSEGNSKLNILLVTFQKGKKRVILTRWRKTCRFSIRIEPSPTRCPLISFSHCHMRIATNTDTKKINYKKVIETSLFFIER